MENIQKRYIKRKVEEHEQTMNELKDQLENASHSLTNGFVGSTIDTTMKYREAAAKYEALKDVVDYLDI